VNEYLTRLRALNLKKGLPEQPSKPTKPSFEGFVGDPSRGVSKNQSEPDQCLQCGDPIGPGSREVTVRSTSDGQLEKVHLDCLDAWQRRGPSQ